MKHFITKLNEALNLQLQIIDFETDNILEKSQKSYTCVSNALKQLKAFVLEYTCHSLNSFLFVVLIMFNNLIDLIVLICVCA